MILQLIREDKTPTHKQVIFLSIFNNSRRWYHSAAVRQDPGTWRSQGLSSAEIQFSKTKTVTEIKILI